MKAKLFYSFLILLAMSCSSKEEKKSDSEEKDEAKDEATIESSAEEAPEEEMSEGTTGEEIPSMNNKNVDVTESSDASGLEKMKGSGTGSGINAKKIEVNSDITVGEEGVR